MALHQLSDQSGQIRTTGLSANTISVQTFHNLTVIHLKQQIARISIIVQSLGTAARWQIPFSKDTFVHAELNNT